MIIEFRKEGDRQLCTQQGVARVSFGIANEKKLLKVITTLNGSITLWDLKATHPKAHWLDGDRLWQVSVPLADGKRLIIEPLEYVTREWNKIIAVRFIEITDYHK